MLLAMPTVGDCLVGLPPEKYDATVARLRRIFLGFSRAAWSGMAPQAGGKEIWCNCGAFAPYFFDACWIGFWIHIMLCNFLTRIAEHPARGPINRLWAR